jgi:uncharacterized OB-fold protein
MNGGIRIWRCQQCREAFFPRPLLCPRCHGGAFEPDLIYRGVVEEVAVIRHMLGQENWQPRRIANVRLAEGQRLTVGLLDESRPGTVIQLFEENGAPFGAEKLAGAERKPD